MNLFNCMASTEMARQCFWKKLTRHKLMEKVRPAFLKTWYSQRHSEWRLIDEERNARISIKAESKNTLNQRPDIGMQLFLFCFAQ